MMLLLLVTHIYFRLQCSHLPAFPQLKLTMFITKYFNCLCPVQISVHISNLIHSSCLFLSSPCWNLSVQHRTFIFMVEKLFPLSISFAHSVTISTTMKQGLSQPRLPSQPNTQLPAINLKMEANSGPAALLPPQRPSPGCDCEQWLPTILLSYLLCVSRS